MVQYQIILSGNWHEYLNLEELAARTGIHPDLIERLVDFGLVEPAGELNGQTLFEMEAVPRLQMIQRLRCDIGLNLPGIAVILDLTEQIRKLQREIDRLRSCY